MVARTRPSAYQWYVVMKYLDNLIAWGDSLFLADTIETLNEATLCYVLAANILGPRPQVMPQPRRASPKNFRQLKQAGLDRMSNALVSLEAQFPFNLVPGPGSRRRHRATRAARCSASGARCTSASRRTRTCSPTGTPSPTGCSRSATARTSRASCSNSRCSTRRSIPACWSQAAAAGIDIGSIVSGLNQPLGPVRSPLLIQKALEIAAEVRALGSAPAGSSLEKGDAEQLALLRQGHEIQLQQMVQNVRYLQWQHAQETTNGLLKTRAITLERYTYYLRLLSLTPDQATVPPDFTPDRRELTEANFADTYSALVGEYDLAIATLAYNPLQLAQGTSPSTQSGATGPGQLYLNKNEDAELNTHLPTAGTPARGEHRNAVAAAVSPFPSAEAHLAFWGIGVHSKLFDGQTLAGVAKLAGRDVLRSSRAGSRTRRASPRAPPATSGAPTNGRCRPTSPRASWPRSAGRSSPR